MVKSKKSKQKILLIGAVVLLFVSVLSFNTFVKGATFFYGLFFNKNIELKQEKNGNINILLMGIGGGTHDGPNLTDTIIVASINQKENKVNLLSIPRDLWIPDLKSKINQAYDDGQKKKDKGILLSKAVVQKVTGIQLDYAVVLDFSGFVKLVDYLYGIDVDVKNVLDDYRYPIEGKENEACGHNDEDIKKFVATVAAEKDIWDFFSCRYKHLHVDSGKVHMDGITALEYVRSRHGEGSEGTDFARSQRQQAVIHGIRAKVFSLGIILNPVKVIGVINILKQNINTDISTPEYDDFIKLARKMGDAKIESTVIDTGNEEENRYGLLINPAISEEYKSQWVLIPRIGNGNFSEIKDYAACLKKGNICSVSEVGIEEEKKVN